MSQIKEIEKRLNIVVCECGFKLIVIPDMNEMIRSIGNHATTHKNSETDRKKAKAEYSRIEELLAQRVLIAISKEIETSSDKQCQAFSYK